MKRIVLHFMLCTFLFIGCGKKDLGNQDVSTSAKSLMSKIDIEKIGIDTLSLKWWVYQPLNSSSGLGPTDHSIIVVCRIKEEMKGQLLEYEDYKQNVSFPFNKNLIKDWYPKSIQNGLKTGNCKLLNAKPLMRRPYDHGFFFVAPDGYMFFFLST